MFVDTTCIDCNTCARVAPAVFGRDDPSGNAIVATQPTDDESMKRALMAVVSCPVGAIGTREPADLRAAVAAFPEEVAPGVYDNGYASRDSYGASSWLVRRPSGNLLVDSPRATNPLLRRIDALGGVATMFLTHRDDVADHAAFRARYGCERVIHQRDATFPVERVVDGDEPILLADDLLVIPVPGHTRGSMALLVDGRYLFTGDHLWGSDGELAASRSVCWWSWDAQIRSMERLLDVGFEWVFPGHGDPLHAPDMRVRLERLIRRM